MLTLDALRILDAIDRRGSQAAAAQELHRVPSAVHHAMQRLQSDLGITLFVRHGRQLCMTPAARTLLEEGRHLLRAADELTSRAQRVATGWEAELTLVMDGLFSVAQIAPLLGLFYQAHQGTRIRILHEVMAGTWDAVLSGRADLAIGSVGDTPPGGRLITHHLGNMPFDLCAPVGHPLSAQAGPLDPHDTLAHRAIVVADSARNLPTRSVGLLAGQPTLTVPTLQAKIEAMRAGLGVGHLPRPIAESEARLGTLTIIQTSAPRPHTPCHLAWRGPGKATDQRARQWFIDHLRAPAAAQHLLSGTLYSGTTSPGKTNADML